MLLESCSLKLSIFKQKYVFNLSQVVQYKIPSSAQQSGGADYVEEEKLQPAAKTPPKAFCGHSVIQRASN